MKRLGTCSSPVARGVGEALQLEGKLQLEWRRPQPQSIACHYHLNDKLPVYFLLVCLVCLKLHSLYEVGT
jgi:hypothetical protein